LHEGSVNDKVDNEAKDAIEHKKQQNAELLVQDDMPNLQEFARRNRERGQPNAKCSSPQPRRSNVFGREDGVGTAAGGTGRRVDSPPPFVKPTQE